MPEVGGKQLASDFASMMADVRKEIDAAKANVTAAVLDLQHEIRNGANTAALALRAEAAEVRKGFSSVVGNNPPADNDNEKLKTDT